uniref:Uncharacterized protein n=1 Tax=Parascaris equorum TaxID=6256 RepID=A0A914RW21_PAREQ
MDINLTMSVLSKFFGDVLGFRIHTANCYELHHTWNPNCYGAIRDAMWDSCSFSFRTYATGLIEELTPKPRKHLANHGYVRLLPNGQIVAFAVGLAGFMYLFRRRLLTQNLCSLLNEICRVRKCPYFSLAICLNDKDEEFINANMFRGAQEVLAMCFSERLSRLRRISLHSKSAAECGHDGNSSVLCFIQQLSNVVLSERLNRYACYRLLVTEGYLPQIPYGDILLYTLSTGYVLWCVTIEPHAIRK